MLTLGLTIALLLGAPVAQAQAQSPSPSPSGTAPAFPHEPGTDPQTRPGDDFFAYANGEWLARTPLPPGRGRWSVRSEIDVLTRQQLDTVFTEAAAAPAGHAGRQLADFEAALADEAALESRGLQPARPALARIAALRTKSDLARHLGRNLRADVDPLHWGVTTSPQLFGLAVQRGIHGEPGHFVYLLQGGLGLPGRDHYLQDTPAATQLRQQYREYVARMLSLAGFEPAAQRADAVLALETSLARYHLDEARSASERNADHRWPRAEFNARAPGMDWQAFFSAAGLGAQREVVAWQPEAIAGQAALVASQPLAVWQDHLRFHLLDQHAATLPRTFFDAARGFRDVAVAGAAQPKSRAQHAREATARALPDTLGRLYAQRWFPPAHKARVQAIATQVISAFARRVEAVPWMAPATRAVALDKLKRVYFGLGYPETWPDLSGLRITAGDAWGNQERVAAWNYRRALERRARPADPTEWVMPAHTVAAILLPLSHTYNFAGALLQSTKFDPAASDAATFGAIGAIVGHEVSHFVDPLGADYDVAGDMKTWWTPEDRARFDAATRPLAQQFSAYQPLPGQAVDGQRTLSENVADLGGLAAAFDAHRTALGARAGERDHVRAQDRAFFIAFARSWRSRSSDAWLQQQLRTDNHAPDAQRMATVRNLDAWYEAFDVRPGQALYLPPEARVRIW